MSQDLPPEGSSPQQPPSGPLPPVEPPTAGFLLQLFLIPLVIVAIIITIWMMFSWLAHIGSSPHDLARSLGTVRDKSWQDAAALADLLRNPQHAHYKEDRELARELAQVLTRQIDAGRIDSNSINLRIFLCRALGEFRVDVPLEALTLAAVTERDEAEIEVRRTALEALAVLARHVGPERVRDYPGTLDAILAASRERADHPPLRERRAQLRERAAFTLGVVGGSDAERRLVQLLGDRYANARYNAATGLARHGNAASVPVLVEMLDPQNQHAAEGEPSETGAQWKRLQVLRNGIRGSEELARQNPAAASDEQLRRALDALVASPLDELPASVHRGIRIHAREALRVVSEPASAGA